MPVEFYVNDADKVERFVAGCAITSSNSQIFGNFLVEHQTPFIMTMIPPNASLVKYDNPVLVSRNTDKKTPRVCVNEIMFKL